MFSKILLFDIDGTLLLSGRAGYRALTRAFEDLFGVVRGFDDVPVAGMTDDLILTDALARAGVTADGEARARFHRRYCELFADEIHFPGPRKGLMPGVSALLERLGSFSQLATYRPFRPMAAGNRFGHPTAVSYSIGAVSDDSGAGALTGTYPD